MRRSLHEVVIVFFFQAEDGIRDLVRSRGLGDVYKRQLFVFAALLVFIATEPSWALVIIAYSYLASAFVGMALTRLRGRRPALPPEA